MAHISPGSLRRRSAVIALGQTAVKASQVLIAVALVRLLSPDEWSSVALMLSVYLAAVTLGSLNLQQSLLFFLPRLDRGQQRRLVMRTAGVMAAAGSAVAAALVVFDPWSPTGSAVGSLATPLVALAIALEIPTCAGPAALLSVDRLVGAAGWDLAGTAVLVTCVVLPAALGWGVRGVVDGLVAAACIKALMFVVVVRRTFPRSSLPLQRGLMKQQLVYGIPLGLTIGASVLNRSVDKWLVAVFDPTNLGVYAIAAQEIPLLAVLPYAGGAAVATILVDAFRRDDRHLARSVWLTQTATMSGIVVPLSAALVIVAPELIALVFTADSAAGVVPFQLFTLITIHRVAEYGMVLRAADRTRDLLTAALVLLGSNAMLAAVGAAWWGMTGASIGTLVANAIAWLFVLGRIARAFDSDLRRSFAWASWSRSVVVATAAAVAATAVAAVIADTVVVSVAVKLVVFAALVGAWYRRAGRDAAARSTESNVIASPTLEVTP